jgi:hypothetical protein
MKVRLTLNVDGEELYRDYNVESIDSVDWNDIILDMNDTLVESHKPL